MEPDVCFQAAFMEYYNEREEFSPESMGQDRWMKDAEEQVSLLLLIQSTMTCALLLY